MSDSRTAITVITVITAMAGLEPAVDATSSATGKADGRVKMSGHDDGLPPSVSLSARSIQIATPGTSMAFMEKLRGIDAVRVCRPARGQSVRPC